MKKFPLTPVLLAIAALISACSTAPKTTNLLDQARSDYSAAQANSNVVKYAPLELKRAGEALALANTAASENQDSEKIDKLAYLAKQNIASTQEVAKQKTAEAS